MCARSVTLLMRERFVKEGKAMPDGRTRRWVNQASEPAQPSDTATPLKPPPGG
ncbi:MAG: hypothetical protein JNM56_31500 [Planctomycetia bacterium]|nr:hypothetical protein [Planctomycetia bacterium]